MTNIFEVKFINNINDLKSLYSTVEDFQKQTTEILRNGDSKFANIFQDCLAELLTIKEVIANKLKNDSLHKEYKIVVSYDSLHQMTQAIGVFSLKNNQTTELFALTTAVWNIDPSLCKYHVKGAGTSIINFCINEANINSSKEICLEATNSAISFYERFHFKKKNESQNQALDIPPKDDFSYMFQRTPMFLNLKPD